MLATDLLRLLVGTAVLAFAAWTDWRWRRAPNVLWLVVAAAGLLLLAVDGLADRAAIAGRGAYLVAAPLFVAFVYVAWRVRLIAGGADAKALMALAFLVPFPIALGPLPLAASPLPGSFAVFGNSLLAFLLVPVGFAAWNLAHGSFRLPHVFLGRRVAVEDLGRGHAWPMERVEEGRVVTHWMPQRREADLDALKEALAKEGRTRVWVTPKVPFMVPLLAGYVGAFVVGDLLGFLVQTALGR